MNKLTCTKTKNKLPVNFARKIWRREGLFVINIPAVPSWRVAGKIEEQEMSARIMAMKVSHNPATRELKIPV